MADFEGNGLEVFLQGENGRCTIRLRNREGEWEATMPAGVVNMLAVELGIRYHLAGPGCCCTIERVGQEVVFKCSSEERQRWTLRVPLETYHKAIANAGDRHAYMA